MSILMTSNKGSLFCLF